MFKSHKLIAAICLVLGTVAFAQTIVSVTPAGPHQVAVAQRLQPDLVITAFTINSPATLHCGNNTVSVTYTERNIGNAPSGPYSTAVYRNGTPFVVLQPGSSSLAAGQIRTVTNTFNFYGGPCDCIPGNLPPVTFSLFIDWGNNVNESNENNNFSTSVTLPWVCP